MDQFLDVSQKRRLFGLVSTFIIVLIIFVAALALNSFKENAYIGSGINVTKTITVSGSGDVMTVPDVGTFSFSVVESAKAVADAQDTAAKKTNDIIAALKGMGIDEKDIQTSDYSTYPKYEYSNTACPLNSGAMYPCGGKQTLVGYEVSETISVKVRKTADAGAALTKVGSLGATDISGLNFVVDNPDAAQAEARGKAITDAKAKADVLAKSLGVHLGKIVNFSEGGSQPIFYSMDKAVMGSGASAPAAIPTLPVGQNKITSNVSITYEID